MIDSNKRIVFFNCFHNGDLHLGRNFVRDISNILQNEVFFYEHHNATKVLKDLDKVKSVPLIHFKKNIAVPNDIIHTENYAFINTWIGQMGCKHIKEGITLDSYYRMFAEIYEKLGILKDLKEKKYYLPKINYYSYDNISIIEDFMKEKTKNIFISNQEVHSGQTVNFGFDNAIIQACEKFQNCNFFVTGKNTILENQKKRNLFFTTDIIGQVGNDLNENSYISKFCNLIIGRQSGPFCFSMTMDNYTDANKTFVCFDNNPKQGIWVSPEDEFVKSKTYTYGYYGQEHLEQTLNKHIEQTFSRSE